MKQSTFAIKWSPSVDRQYYKLDWWVGKSELFPPFVQKKSPEHAEYLKLEGTPDVPAAFEDAGGDAPLDTVCHNLKISHAEKLKLQHARKFLAHCWEDCGTTWWTCDESRGELDKKSTTDVEIVAEERIDVFKPYYEEDYRRYGEDFVVDDEEEEEEKPREERFHWSDMCEGLLPISDVEEVPSNTADPYISHKLTNDRNLSSNDFDGEVCLGQVVQGGNGQRYLPYNQMPRPRCFKRADKEVDYTVTSIPRRPRSPVRVVPRGKFDLKAARDEWTRKQKLTEPGRTLMEAKEHISESIRRLSRDRDDEDVLISSVVLETVCEEVTLTLMGAKIDTDVHTFVNIAVIWALTELKIFSRDMLLDEQFQLPEDFLSIDHNRRSILGIAGNGGMRKVLLGVYRPPFSRNTYTTLHRRLPWSFVSSSHERGHMKLYPTIRERISEKLPKMALYDYMSSYIPAATCFHLRDISEKSDVAYTRKSKLYGLSLDGSNRTADKSFGQLMNLT